MKENSIKEAIILLKDFTEGNFKRDKLENYKGSYKMGYFYYKDIQQAIEHLLSEVDIKEKDIEGWKKYCEEIEEEQTEMSNKNYELEFEVEKLQKENEELKNKNKTLEELLQGTLYEMYKYYRDLANSYQANCILKEKVKDKIEELEKDEYSKYYYMFLEERDLKYTIQILQELLEESEDSKDGEG